MLKENEYIRTNLGNILKYTGKEKEFIDKHLSISNKKDIEFLGTIVKHSKNIIDLLEVEDYVNGERILDITGDYVHTNETDHNKFYLEKHIRTILTKEIYQANCYTVERKEE